MTAQSIHPRRPGRAARIARAEAAFPPFPPPGVENFPPKNLPLPMKKADENPSFTGRMGKRGAISGEKGRACGKLPAAGRKKARQAGGPFL